MSGQANTSAAAGTQAAAANCESGSQAVPAVPAVPAECKFCGKTAEQAGISKIRLCLRCYKVGYCCKECQSSDWKAHKPACTPPDHKDVPAAVAQEVSNSTRTKVMGSSKVSDGEGSTMVAFDRGDLPATLAAMANKSKFWLVPLPPHRPRALAGLLTPSDIKGALSAKRVATSNVRKTIDPSGGRREFDVKYHYDDKAPRGNAFNMSTIACSTSPWSWSSCSCVYLNLHLRAVFSF